MFQHHLVEEYQNVRDALVCQWAADASSNQKNNRQWSEIYFRMKEINEVIAMLDMTLLMWTFYPHELIKKCIVKHEININKNLNFFTKKRLFKIKNHLYIVFTLYAHEKCALHNLFQRFR